jgi:hypothetical protein
MADQTVMLLSLFFSAAFSTNAVGLDLGTQFFKVARSTSNGQVQIHIDPVSNSASLPSAVAIKFQTPNGTLLTDRDFEDIEFRFGAPARRLLKSNRSLGYEFPVRALGRPNDSEFYTGTIGSEFELFALALEHSLRNVEPVDSLTIATPVFFTRWQYIAVNDACRRFRIPLIALISDNNAVMLAYASLRLSRFLHRGKHVMFIDVGATATKVYSMVFEYVNSSIPGKDFVKSDQTSVEWSEKVGGYYFSKAVAREKGWSISKAQKMLQGNNGEGYEQFVEEELDVFEGLIINATVQAEAVAPIDEIQVIGGASTLKFVVDTIKRVTNHSIRRDFNSNEAVALGAAIASLDENEQSPYITVRMRPLHHSTVHLKCGNTTVPICAKGTRCEETVKLENLSEICEICEQYVDPSHLPTGAVTRPTRYNTTRGAHLEGDGNFTGIFLIGPEAAITGVRWCNANGDCIDREPELLPVDENEESEEYNLVYRYIQARMNKETRQKVIDYLEKLNALRAKLEKANVESPRPMTEDMKETLTQLTAMVEADKLESLGTEALRNWATKIDAIAKKMNVKL